MNCPVVRDDPGWRDLWIAFAVFERNYYGLAANLWQKGIGGGKVYWHYMREKPLTSEELTEFGNRGKIKRFDLVWRNLAPHEIRPLASPNEVIALIREGRAVAPMQDFDWTASLHATQLTITDVRLYYFDRPGMEPLDFMYPYAELELAAHSGTNTSTFYLTCPILSSNTASTTKEESSRARN
jgi:hypothetical protein